MANNKPQKSFTSRDWLPSPFDTWIGMYILGSVSYSMVYQFPYLKFGIGYLPLHIVFGFSLLFYAFYFFGSIGDARGKNFGERLVYSWRRIFILTVTYLPIPISYVYKIFFW